MRGKPASSEPFDVYVVRHDDWAVIWFDLNHGKAEMFRKQVKRDFPDAKWVGKSRVWYLGKDYDNSKLLTWRNLGATLVRMTTADLTERGMIETHDVHARRIYEAYKLGVRHGGKGGEQLAHVWDCARSWDAMEDDSPTEPVDKNYFRTLARKIKDGD